MIKWQQGEQDMARQLFAEIQPAVDKEFQFPSTAWNGRASLELLHAEAESLIAIERSR
jgi:hypothetical protein